MTKLRPRLVSPASRIEFACLGKQTYSRSSNLSGVGCTFAALYRCSANAQFLNFLKRLAKRDPLFTCSNASSFMSIPTPSTLVHACTQILAKMHSHNSCHELGNFILRTTQEISFVASAFAVMDTLLHTKGYISSCSCRSDHFTTSPIPRMLMCCSSHACIAYTHNEMQQLALEVRDT